MRIITGLEIVRNTEINSFLELNEPIEIALYILNHHCSYYCCQISAAVGSQTETLKPIVQKVIKKSMIFQNTELRVNLILLSVQLSEII